MLTLKSLGVLANLLWDLESSEMSILNIYISFFHTVYVSFMNVLHLPCKSFHLFPGIGKKNTTLINNEIASYVCTKEIISAM